MREWRTRSGLSQRGEARVGIVFCLKSLNTLDATRIRPYLPLF